MTWLCNRFLILLFLANNQKLLLSFQRIQNFSPDLPVLQKLLKAVQQGNHFTQQSLEWAHWPWSIWLDPGKCWKIPPQQGYLNCLKPYWNSKHTLEVEDPRSWCGLASGAFPIQSTSSTQSTLRLISVHLSVMFYGCVCKKKYLMLYNTFYLWS